jgi:glutamyl-tRNA reductase
MNSPFVSIGVSHWQSPVEVREQFSMNREQSAALIQKALLLGVNSIFTVSTCNRTQLFAHGGNPHQLKELFSKHSQGKITDLEKYGFILQGEEAISNLFEVSTGLDSQILGDLQIFSQVKEGVEQAKKLGSLDGVTDRLLQFVFQANKEVQSFTKISKGAASVAHAAVLYVRNKFDKLTDKNILLFGTGEIGERTLENITSHQFSQVTVINRTLEKAESIAQKHGVNVAPIDDLELQIQAADIVMVATGAQTPTLTPSHLNGCVNDKLLIDLSVPRNISPSVMESSNIELVDMDKLREVADQTLAERRKDIPKARTIINLHKMEFNDWRKMHRLGPTIKALNLAFEEEKQDEINRHKGKYTAEELEKLQPLVNSILKRISSKNIEYLRKRYRHNEDILEIIQEMYKIDAH